jgi:hypothetical protein
MKESSGLGTTRRNLFTSPDMSRRDFLSTGIGLAAAVSGFEMIAGCASEKYLKEGPASPTTQRAQPVIAHRLPYNKIQPPREGCLLGLQRNKVYGANAISLSKYEELESKAKDFNEFRTILKSDQYFKSVPKKRVDENIRYYEQNLGILPSIIVLQIGEKLFLPFPKEESIELTRRGILPYVNACIGDHKVGGRGQAMVIDNIPVGQYDDCIREFAQGALVFGKEYGGFFFTTMEEANGYWYKWAGNSSKYISAWRHLWDMFENFGTNQYATWVWEAYCPISPRIEDPEFYYPGDKYVDWIGINAYSVAGSRTTDKPLHILIYETYRKIKKAHPEKPIMLSEFARTNEYGQKSWLRDAYSRLKNDFPEIKAAIFYDNVWTLTGDHTLSEGGLAALKEILKDPYWIMARM